MERPLLQQEVRVQLNGVAKLFILDFVSERFLKSVHFQFTLIECLVGLLITRHLRLLNFAWDFIVFESSLIRANEILVGLLPQQIKCFPVLRILSQNELIYHTGLKHPIYQLPILVTLYCERLHLANDLVQILVYLFVRYFYVRAKPLLELN